MSPTLWTGNTTCKFHSAIIPEVDLAQYLHTVSKAFLSVVMWLYIRYTNFTLITNTSPKPEVAITGSSYTFFTVGGYWRITVNKWFTVYWTILCVIIDIDMVHFITPTHMKRSSCRPDVVKHYGGSETGSCLHKLHNNVYNVFRVVTRVL